MREVRTLTNKDLHITTIITVTALDIVLGTAVCKSNMNPFVKLLIVASLLNDAPRVIANTKRLYRQWCSRPKES